MSERLSRRSLLSRLGIAAGVLGTTGMTGVTGASAREVTASRSSALPNVIYGTDWRVIWPDVKPGTRPTPDSPRLPHGRLVDGAGEALGAFEASVMLTGGRGTHLHRLELSDGTITAAGPATFDDATFAVIGGTGRYSGASGSYHLVQRPSPTGGTATFTLDITTPEV
jgi:hypothetical protein